MVRKAKDGQRALERSINTKKEDLAAIEFDQLPLAKMTKQKGTKNKTIVMVVNKMKEELNDMVIK